MSRWQTIALVAVVALSIVFVGVITYGIVELGNQNERTRELAARIQDQRRMSIFETCVDQNRRRADTIARIDRLIAGLPPEDRERALMGRANTVLIINGLVPREKCFARTRRLTGRAP